MKNNYTLIIYKFIFLIILFLPNFTYSQCNVSHTSSNISYAANSIPHVFGQSFKATCSGNMQYFQLISSETGTISSGTLNIYNGDTVSGTPIYTQSYPQLIILAAGAPITFNITGTAPLVLNNQYTFVFTVDNVDFKYDITAMYPDGETWQDGFPVPNVDLIFTVLINNNLGINEYNQLKKIKIYPNPSNAFIKISNLTSVEKYSIYNLLGEKIIVDSISNDEKIDIQDLANGIYFLKFENGNTLKFLKE